jgi:hypothetical protein
MKWLQRGTLVGDQLNDQDLSTNAWNHSERVGSPPERRSRNVRAVK